MGAKGRHIVPCGRVAGQRWQSFRRRGRRCTAIRALSESCRCTKISFSRTRVADVDSLRTAKCGRRRRRNPALDISCVVFIQYGLKFGTTSLNYTSQMTSKKESSIRCTVAARCGIFSCFHPTFRPVGVSVSRPYRYDRISVVEGPSQKLMCH